MKLFTAEDFIADNVYGDAVMIQARWSADRANEKLKKWLKDTPRLKTQKQIEMMRETLSWIDKVSAMGWEYRDQASHCLKAIDELE